MTRAATEGPADTRIPVALLIPTTLGLALLVIPLVGLTIRAPWPRLIEILTSGAVLSALRLSLVTASVATLICLVLGVPLAWLLARSAVPGRAVLRGLVTVPLVLPPVIGGIALLVAFGR